MRHIPRILNCAAVKIFTELDTISDQTSTERCNQAMFLSGDITQLAICQINEGSGFALYYCDDEWKTLQAQYFSTLDEALRHAVDEYPVVSGKWLTPQEATKRQGKYAMDPHCAFCRRTFSGYKKLIAGDGAYICYACIDYYYGYYILERPGRQNASPPHISP